MASLIAPKIWISQSRDSKYVHIYFALLVFKYFVLLFVTHPKMSQIFVPRNIRKLLMIIDYKYIKF
jgi:hypothetical protein